MDPFSLLASFVLKKCTIGEICLSLYETNFRWWKLLVMPRLFIHCKKYMRKFKNHENEETERRIFILYFLYIISFVNFFFFSNGVMDGWNLWEKKNKNKKEEIERRIFIIYFLYIISFVNYFFLFKSSNRWLESLGEWTSIFEEEYGILGCLIDFVL
jgi:hypothetical protein